MISTILSIVALVASIIAMHTAHTALEETKSLMRWLRREWGKFHD